ncbi:MAG: hypothetical protein GQ574_13560 [Crocinitomix sp.]|nr:hypothetical protein [Crocinitomix sp.]
MKIGFSILTLVLVFISANCYSQEYNHYDLNDLYDFEESTVFDILQDKNANIWLGTNEGLVKFNGIEFTYFTPKGYGKAASDIEEDEQGRIWFSNFHGQLFYVENDSLHLGLDNGITHTFIYEYYIDYPYVIYSNKDGQKIVKHNLNTKKDSIIHDGSDQVILAAKIRFDEFIFAKTIRDSIDPANRTWEFWVYHVSADELEKIAERKVQIKSSSYGILVNEEALYFWQANERLKVIQIKDGSTHLLLDEILFFNSVMNGFELIDGNLAVLTKSGFYLFPLGTKSVKSYQHFSSANVSHIFVDQEKNWWITTLNDGIKIIVNPNFTHHIISDLEITHSCSGSDGDLFLITVNGDLYKTFPPYTTAEFIGKKDLIAGSAIAYNDSSKIIYMNSSSYCYHTVANQFIPHTIKTDGRQTRTGFRKLLFLNEAEAIMCSYNITELVNINGLPISERMKKYKGIKSNFTEMLVLDNVNAYHVASEKRKEDFYVSFKNGLYHYSYEEPHEVKYEGNNVITTAMIQAKDSGVWVGTNEGKLLKVEDGIITDSQSLPSEFRGIVEWKNTLFLATKREVYKYNLETNSHQVLDRTDGLLKEDIVNLYIYQDTLLVLGENSLQKIPCNYGGINENPPILRIESISLFDQKIESNDLQFEHNENSITIHFSATAIRSQKKCIYQYRLNKGDWIETTGSAAFARFPKLAPDNYNFEVRALNEDGLSSKIHTIQFSIDAHFTEKWWFIRFQV